MLLDLIDTLPVDQRREILVWLLGQSRPVGAIGLTPSAELRRVLSNFAGTLPAGEESQLVTIRLPAERHAELRTWCNEHSFTMAAVVRGLIERFLDENRGGDRGENRSR
jgi:hypothetical protein